MFSETEDYLNVTKVIYEKQRVPSQIETVQENESISSEDKRINESNNNNGQQLATAPTSRKFILDTGEYIYPFSVDLPRNIPETFEHSYGMIQYSISAYLDIPMYSF